MLSTLSEAPIIPCVILGSDRLYNPRNWLPWRRPKIWIGYGKPILPTKACWPARSRRTSRGKLFGSEIVKLKERLCEDFGLTTSRFATSSQERMKEP